MALTYDKVIGVISQPPSNRKDFEVNNLLHWFRKKSDLFKNLKTDLLFDLVKNLKFTTKKRDELIIRQGDNGDCMYILLRGQVTIYILYPKPAEDGEEKQSKGPLVPQIGLANDESIRQQLGTFVTNLGPGATFGEVALLKEDDCIRTASIIASDNTVDLIEINRDLYNRSVKKVLQQEFEDKTNFIANNPFFQTWAAKYKKQLAMALEKDVIPYDGLITKQSEPLSAIYFILKGEVKVIMDPSQHRIQYSKYYEHDDGPLPRHKRKPTSAEEQQERVEELIQSMTRERSNSDSASLENCKHRMKKAKKIPTEVCLLGVNEVVGDIETLLDMETYMQTAKCTQRTEVLVLEMKHYERLLVKRNPRTIETMKGCLDLRVKSRMSKHNENQIPLLRLLYNCTENLHAKQEGKSHTKNEKTHHEKIRHKKTIAEYYDTFIPPPGPLINMYGPGTVFHRIREREKQKREAKANKRTKQTSLTFHDPHVENKGGNPLSKSFDYHGGDHHDDGAEYIDPMTSEPILRSLEERMRQWLEWDGTKHRGKINKLHRTSVEEESLKPGAKVVFRSRSDARNLTPPEDDADTEEREYIHHGKSFV